MALVITNFKCTACGYDYAEIKKSDGQVYRRVGNKMPLVFEALTRFVQAEFASQPLLPTLPIIIMVCPHCATAHIDVPKGLSQQVVNACTLEMRPVAEGLPGAANYESPPEPPPEKPGKKDRGFDLN